MLQSHAISLGLCDANAELLSMSEQGIALVRQCRAISLEFCGADAEVVDLIA